MPKAYRHKTNPKYVSIYCPGCKHEHTVNVEQDGEIPPWGFNGDLENPTFTPSILVRGVDCEYDLEGWPIASTRKDSVCHSFVTTGFIQFIGDCTHELVGQTVELPNRYDGKD